MQESRKDTSQEFQGINARKKKLEFITSKKKRKNTPQNLEGWTCTFNAVAIADLKGNLTYVNDEFLRVWGYDAFSEILGKPVGKFWQMEEQVAERAKTLLYEENLVEEVTAQRKDGTHFLIQVTTGIVLDKAGKPAFMINTFKDVTMQTHVQQEREITIELLHLLNSNNQKHELMRLVTRLLKNWSQCDAIGIRLQEGEDFPYYETSGFPEDFILAENYLCSKNELGQIELDHNYKPYLECMCGNIICGRFDPSKPFFTEHGSFWTNSTTELLAGTTETDRMARTRNRCNAAGYESVALIPLRTGKKTFGLLQFNDKRKGRFSSEKISLFERLADSLAMSLAQKQAEEKLKESEERFRTLFESTQEGLVTVDSKDQILFANQATAKILGYASPSDLVGKHTAEFYADLKQREIVLKELNKKDYIRDFEITAKKKNNTNVYVLLSITIQRDDKGNFVCSNGIFRDITERKQAEEALRASEERFKGIFENSLVGIFRTTPDGRILMVNPAIVKMLGYESFEELSKVNLQEYGFAPEHPRSEFIRQIEEEDKVTGFESVWCKKDGSTLFVRESAQAIRDKDGNTLYYEGTVEDITERKRAEVALAESEARYRAIIEDQTELICRYLPDGTITFVNQAYCRYFGKEFDELVGSTFYPLIVDEDRIKVQQAISTLSPQNPLVSIEERVILPDEQIRWQQWISRLILDEQNQVIEIQAVGRDITERKQAEEELANREAELRSLLDGSDDSIYAVDGDCRYIFVNDEHLSRIFNSGRISQKRSEKVIGKRYQDLHPEEESKEFIKNVDKVFETGESVQYEYKWPKIGKWSNRILSPIKDLETGKIKSVSVISRDITDRKQAEQELKRERNLLRLFIDNIPDRIFLKDNEYRFILGNNAVVRHKGFKSEDELIGKTDFDFYPEKDAKVFYSEEKEIIKKGKSVINQKCFYKDKSGNEEWSLLTKVPLRNLNGDIIGLAGIKRIITEQKKAEDALIASEEKYKSLFDNSISGIGLSKGNRVISANKALLNIFGYDSLEEFTGIPLLDHIAPESKKIIRDMIQLRKKGKLESITYFEYKIIRKDGKTRDLEISSTQISIEGENYTLSTFNDITERKRAEGKIAELAKFPEENPHPVLRLTENGTIIYSNKAGSIILETWNRKVGERLPEDYQNRIEQILQSSEVTCFEFECHNGRIFEITIAPILEMGYINIYGLDITQRKYVEDSLLKYHEQLKSLASKLTITEEHERYRIATELHDHICQSLAMSKIKLETLIYSKISNDTRGSLTEVCKWLTQVIENTRSLTFDLSSPILYELGFEKAVAAWLEDEIQQKHNIETEFKDDGQFKPLDNDVRALLFRDVRELLINIVKHAHANRVKVYISKVKDRISVIVEDDGKGFDPLKIANAGINRTGFGLFSIRQRLEYLGGLFEIDSSPGKGCRITMLAPLKR